VDVLEFDRFTPCRGEVRGQPVAKLFERRGHGAG
jgi:hypothetical protein